MSRGHICGGHGEDFGWQVGRGRKSDGNGGGCGVRYPQCDWGGKRGEPGEERWAKSVVKRDVRRQRKYDLANVGKVKVRRFPSTY